MGLSFNNSSDLNQKDIENVQSSGAQGPDLRTTVFPCPQTSPCLKGLTSGSQQQNH